MKRKRLKGNALVTIIIILAIIGIAVILYLKFFGKGNGMGINMNNTEPVNELPVVSATPIITAVEVEQENFITVTVSGNSYIFENKKYKINDLIKEVSKYNMSISVVDDKASKKAYDKLIEALKENNIKYMEK